MILTNDQIHQAAANALAKGVPVAQVKQMMAQALDEQNAAKQQAVNSPGGPPVPPSDGGGATTPSGPPIPPSAGGPTQPGMSPGQATGGPPIPPSSMGGATPPISNAQADANMGGKIAGGIMGALSPANIPGEIANAAEGAAGMISKIPATMKVQSGPASETGNPNPPAGQATAPAAPPPAPSPLETGAKMVQEAGAGALSGFAKGAGNLIQTAGQAGDMAMETMTPGGIARMAAGAPPEQPLESVTKPIQQGANWLGDQPEQVLQKLGLNPNSVASNVGKFAGNVASQVPALVTGAEGLEAAKATEGAQTLATKFPLISKVANFITGSAGQTNIMQGAQTGEVAKPGDLAAYGALDLLTSGAERMGAGIYEGAFKGTKTQEKNLITSFNQTVADVATKLGYTGSAKDIMSQAQEANRGIWTNIVAAAQKGEPITKDQFMGIANDLVKPFQKLPDSQFKDEAIQSIKDVVSTYAPKTTATGDQLVNTITQINKGLFGDGTRVVLSPKQVSSVTAQLKSGIKDLLPAEVKPLYTKYANNKLIEQVMQNSEVKRLVGRTTVGAATGAIVAGGGEIAQGKLQSDPMGLLRDTIASALIGAAGARLTGNTAVATVGGKLLQKAAPTVDILVKNIVSSFLSKAKSGKSAPTDSNSQTTQTP